MSDIEREEFNQWILDSEYALASPATRRWFFDVWQAARAQDAEPVAWGIFYCGVFQEHGWSKEAAEAIAREDYVGLENIEVRSVYTRPPAASQWVPEVLQVLAKWMDTGGPTFHEAEAIGMAISGPVKCSDAFKCRMAAKAAFLEAAKIWQASTPPQPMEDA